MLAMHIFPPSHFSNYKPHLLGKHGGCEEGTPLSRSTVASFKCLHPATGRSRFIVWHGRQWYHGHQVLLGCPCGGSTTQLITAGLLDAWWTCSVHLPGGITTWLVEYWKKSGTAGLIETKRWECPSLWWDIPRATSAHPATSVGQMLAASAAPTSLWPP